MNRYALSFLNRSFDPEALDGQHSTTIQYSIENIQSLEDGERISIQFFCHKMHKNNYYVLKKEPLHEKGGRIFS